jgi:Tol biopolymer transport system component
MAGLLAIVLTAAPACTGGGQSPDATTSIRGGPKVAPGPLDLSTSSLDSIVFVSDRAGGLQIYSMLADGRSQVRLTDDSAIDAWPVWSIDRTRIAFASTRDGKSDVFLMPAKGGQVVRLTTNPADDYHPSWSPDGTRIAFESLRDGNAEIYVMNADGTGQTRLTRNPGLDGSPAWSPNGRLIAFESERGGNEDIYTMRPDGSHLRRLTTAPGEDTDPAWAPDGTRIAFTSSRQGQPRLFMMRADGSDQFPIPLRTPGENGGGTGMWMDATPAWSPDGEWIAFSTTRSGTLQIWAMRPDGTGLVRLTTYGNNGAPSWS